MRAPHEGARQLLRGGEDSGHEGGIDAGCWGGTARREARGEREGEEFEWRSMVNKNETKKKKSKTTGLAFSRFLFFSPSPSSLSFPLF
jgi:hypothetical protein